MGPMLMKGGWIQIIRSTHLITSQCDRFTKWVTLQWVVQTWPPVILEFLRGPSKHFKGMVDYHIILILFYFMLGFFKVQ